MNKRYKGKFQSADRVLLNIDYYSYAHRKSFPVGTRAIVTNTQNPDAEFGYIIIAIWDKDTNSFTVNEMANEKYLDLE